MGKLNDPNSRFGRWTRYFVGTLVSVIGLIGFLIPVIPGGFLLFFIGLHILKPSVAKKGLAWMKVAKIKTFIAIKKARRLVFKALQKLFLRDKE